jgi:cysteine desulfurase
MKKKVEYWDNAATTKVDKRVLDTMMPYFTELFGNASSSHQFGQLSKVAIEKARAQVASLINSETDEIIFTSGATESINLALKGFVEFNYHRGNHIITVKTEHKAVIATCEFLEQRGIEVTYLDVDRNGLISLESLRNSIKSSTILISIMYVNNEIGVIQPIKQIGEIARENSIAFFCDATQAVGKIKVDVEADNIDMLSFSGHKINGPKGVGVLFKKKTIGMQPLIHGGSQENGLRPGTYNTPLIVGIGKACELTEEEIEKRLITVNEVAKKLSDQLGKLNGVKILVDSILRVPHIMNVYVDGLDASLFVDNLTSIALSTGSACNSSLITSSHVLKAMGVSEEKALSCFRLSIDYSSKIDPLDDFCRQIESYDISK